MAVKTERMEARMSPEEREQIERAATVVGLSASAFMVNAAVDRAAEIITQSTTTTVPSEYFDTLLEELDAAAPAPRLAQAARDSVRRRRIQDR
jgi:uncharacterized protein (DUF1778 family)